MDAVNQETPVVNSLLGVHYKYLEEIAAETVSALGEEQAGYFTYLANDWMDILAAISDAYPEDERLHSLVFFYLSGLFKEVTWFQLLFLSGNYPLLHRSLRYVWEMMFRAYYVDTYVQQSESDPAPPGPTIDEKVEWLAQHEKKRMSGWGFIRSLLLQHLPQAQGTEMEECYRSLWNTLNEYVHPSKALLDRMMTWAPESWVRDAFSEEWALATIHTATMVFDLVWMIVISRFPDCAEEIAQKGLRVRYPITTTALARYSLDEGNEPPSAQVRPAGGYTSGGAGVRGQDP